jgi:pyrophosphatase PpaX
MEQRIKCVLFDLDGTLINTNDLVIASFKHTVRKHLNKEIAEEELYCYFGEPLIDIMHKLDPDQADQMVKTYREFNLNRHDELTTPFPGAADMLADLNRRGFRLGVVTSKIRHMAERGLRLFGLDRWMDVLVGFEDTEYHKPHPEPINIALDRLDTRPGEVLMVGDSPFDLECARNAGVMSAAVKWSVHPKERLLSCKPDLFLNSFYELPEIV